MNTKTDSLNRRGFLKGLAIGAGGYAIGFPSIHPSEAVGQSGEDYLEEIPMQCRWAIAASASVNNSVSFSKYRYDVEGQEKYNEGAKIRNQRAGAWMLQFAYRNSVTAKGKRDAKSMAEILPALISVFHGPFQRYEIEEATAEKARVKCIHCSICNAMQEMKITDDLCSVGCQFMWEGFAEYMNPKLTSTMVKAKLRGDSVCEWVIELKA